MPRNVLVLLLFLSLSPAVAHADLQPAAATLDRQQGHSGFAASLSYSHTDIDTTSFSLTRLDVYGEARVGDTLSLYGQVHAVRGDSLGGRSSSLGNAEAGVAYRVPRTDADLVLHAGLVLPTGAAADMDGDALLADAFGSYGRFTDQAATIKDVTWLRLAVSPVARRGRWHLRVDIGVDIPVFEPELAAQPIWRVQPEPLGRLNAAAAVDLGRVYVAGELSTLMGRAGIPTRDDNDGESFVTTAALTLGVTSKRWSPAVTMAAPMAGEMRGNLWAVTAGVRGSR